MTVVDSNVFIAVWDRGDSLNTLAVRALERALALGPVTCPAPVFAELLAGPSRTGEFLDEFFRDIGIRIDWSLAEQVWRSAAAAFQSYSTRRGQSVSGPRRILADFLIGAYAAHHRARLLTLDRKLYSSAFPQLEITVP